MELERKVNALQRLGMIFEAVGDETSQSLETAEASLAEEGKLAVVQAKQYNSWFTEEQVKHSLTAWAGALGKKQIADWLKSYPNAGSGQAKEVGAIMAGNIPLVGLHDALCVLLAGHRLNAKLSSKDQVLMKWVLSALAVLEPAWKDTIRLTEKLNNIDALIATGSDNSARYFEYYFREKPKIIRKNRTSAGILSEEVNEDQLAALAKDVFTYFGMGCRNVGKLYLPQSFDLDRLFKAFYPYREYINHHSYANNYDYNKAVYLMNKIELRENGFLLMKEDAGLHAPLAVLFYERYNKVEEVMSNLKEKEDQLQLIVSDRPLPIETVLPGEAQKPAIDDYADKVDTMQFLIQL
jgi:hypothetical protein